MKFKLKGLCLICLIVIIVIIVIVLNISKSDKIINLDNLEKTLLKQYSELNLKKLDKYDISEYFGIVVDDNTSYLFLTNFENDEANPVPFDPQNLIVVVNSKDYMDYYNTLKDYIDGIIQNTEDYQKINLYKNALLKSNQNYFYLVIGMDNNIETIINNYLQSN